MSDDLTCCAIRVCTRRFLESIGARAAGDYVLHILIRDGSVVPVACNSLDRVRSLIAELQPRGLTTLTHECEDTEALLAIVGSFEVMPATAAISKAMH